MLLEEVDMKARTNVKIKLLFLMILASTFILTFPAVGLSLADVLGKIDQTFEVRAALLAVESMEHQIAELRYPGDVAVTVQPSATASTPEGGPFAETVDLSGSVSVNVPVGLSDSREQALLDASIRLELTKVELEGARANAFIRLYSLYQDAWLAQQEMQVLTLENEADRLRYDLQKKLFESGEIALTDLSRAEEDFIQAQSALLQGGLNGRLAWFELSSAIGLSRSDETRLEESLDSFGLLVKPPFLSSWAGENDPAVLYQKDRVRQIEESMAELNRVDISSTFKATLNAFSHSASLSLNMDSPSLSGSYSFPLYTFGDTSSSSGSGAGTWNLGFQMSLSYSSSKGDNLEAASLLVDLERETVRLETLLESVDLEIRSKYQQYLLSEDSVDQAERNLEITLENRKIVLERKDLGLVLEDEVIEAESQVARARWQVMSAKVKREKAEMAAAQAAFYFAQYLSKGE